LSKNMAVFVDVANLYYSARGLEVDVDYVALLKAATKGRDLIRAYAYSGLDPENENQRKFIDFLGKNDYKVVHKDIRKFGDGRVKANLDIELVVDLFRLADRMDIAVIVSGDGDFAPAIRALQDKGVRCEVISFRPNTSSDLIAVADEFIDIMKIIGIGRGKDADKASKVMSAPPMPAKEVVPEFGFREAPASVAAAALAAIREGGAKPAGRGRGRGGARPEPALVEALAPGTEEPPEAPTTSEVASDGTGSEARRRRRRRGGRGRGRGRGRAEEVGVAATTAPAPETEIGWAELEDISQVGLADTDEEREYTFEEADAATLAELGLPALQEEGVTAPEAEAVKPRRRRAAAGAAAETKPEEAAKPPRTRSRRGATAETEAAPAEAPVTEPAKPRRRAAKPKADVAKDDSQPTSRTTRSRAKQAAAPEPAAGAEEGIWQRLRGARTKAPYGGLFDLVSRGGFRRSLAGRYRRRDLGGRHLVADRLAIQLAVELAADLISLEDRHPLSGGRGRFPSAGGDFARPGRGDLAGADGGVLGRDGQLVAHLTPRLRRRQDGRDEAGHGAHQQAAEEAAPMALFAARPDAHPGGGVVDQLARHGDRGPGSAEGDGPPAPQAIEAWQHLLAPCAAAPA